MYILNYLLFISFINFYNSFSLIKNYHNLIFQQNNIKLNMGCDYYIDKSLYIYDHENKLISYIRLEHNKGYYYYHSLLDEDEDNYEKDYDEYIKDQLEPSMKPIVIFINNTFSKLSFETKYKKLIDYELNLSSKIWNDVNKIIKKEGRYER